MGYALFSFLIFIPPNVTVKNIIKERKGEEEKTKPSALKKRKFIDKAVIKGVVKEEVKKAPRFIDKERIQRAALDAFYQPRDEEKVWKLQKARKLEKAFD